MHKLPAAMRHLKVWKFYFWFTAFLGLGTLFLDDFMNGVVQLVGVVGLYGYIWSRPVANYMIWQLYLLGLALLFGFQLLKLTDPFVQEALLKNELVAVVIFGLFVLLNGPLCYALVRYSSKNHRAWKQNATHHSSGTR